MYRIKATAIHFIVSIFIFCSIFFILSFLWYPPPYFTAAGGWQGLKIAAAVDLVLGPLLTFVIFDTKKPRKKIIQDFSVILFLQISALIFGIITIYQQRPVASVFWDGSFYVVPASVVEDKNISIRLIENLSDRSPALIYAKKPTQLKGLELMLEKIKDAVAPHHQPDLYRPLSDSFPELLSYQLDMTFVMERNERVKKSMEVFLSNRVENMVDFAYFPLQAKYHNIILIFSMKGELIDFISVPATKVK